MKVTHVIVLLLFAHIMYPSQSHLDCHAKDGSCAPNVSPADGNLSSGENRPVSAWSHCYSTLKQQAELESARQQLTKEGGPVADTQQLSPRGRRGGFVKLPELEENKNPAKQ